MAPKRNSSRWNRILVVLFFLSAIVLAVWASIVFKRMIEDDQLQEKLEEVRPSDSRS